jgi:hypothetical protein
MPTKSRRLNLGLYLRFDPCFDEIRADPCNIALEHRVGLL